MTSFDQATSVTPLNDGSFGWTVPDGWQQGRGAWGGLVVGALLNAVTSSEEDAGRAVRSVNVRMAAPALVGPLVIDVAPGRRGTSMSTWSARLVDERGRLVADLGAMLGSARAADVAASQAGWSTASPPPAPAPDDVEVFPLGPPLGPAFASRIRFRPVEGLPASAGVACTSGWVGYRDPTQVSAVSLISLVDAWWPASLVALDAFRPLATVAFLANLLVDPASIGSDELLLHEGCVASGAAGYSSECRRLWSSDGRLVVDNLQSVVVVA
jgi:hypothetical protein